MRAFPLRPDCPLPSVEAIEGSLVSSCDVPEACTAFDVPFFPPAIPTGFDFGCYLPGLSASIDLFAEEPSFSIELEFPNASETGLCEPLFNFRFDAGEVCLQPNADVEATTEFYEETTIETGRNFEDNQCDLTLGFNFDLSIMCPIITMFGTIVLIPSTSSSSWIGGNSSDVPNQPFGSVFASSAAGTPEGQCAFDFNLTIFWPSVFASLDTELNADTFGCAPAGGTSVCTTQIVKSIDFFRSSSLSSKGGVLPPELVLGFTTMPAWVPTPSVSFLAMEDDSLITPCNPGTDLALIVVDVDQFLDCCDPEWRFATDILEFTWEQEIVLERVFWNFPTEQQVPCCTLFTVLVDVAEDPTTGCEGSLTFETMDLLIPHNSWSVPPYVSSSAGGHFQFISNLDIFGRLDCGLVSSDVSLTCAYEADVARTFTREFPDNGLTLQASANFDPSSSSGATCFFPALKFENGLLVRSFLGTRSCE